MEKYLAIKKISTEFNIPEEEILRVLKTTTKKTRSSKKISNSPQKKVTLPLNKTDTSQKKNRPSTNKFLFLKKDYDLLIEKIEKINKEIERLGQEIGESCTETETFHDNFDYEEGNRQQRMWIEHRSNLVNIKNNAIIIKKKKTKSISIGDKVLIEMENGEKLKKTIGSYMTFSKEELSYASPLGKLLIGKKEGEKITGTIKDKKTTFFIKKIY